MGKAAEAFRNISEVADELEVPKHVLRFWEARFAQLKPMKRGGGRRYYRPEDVELLRGIRDLLQEAGYTIKGVQKILREQGVDHVKCAAGGALQEKARRRRAALEPGTAKPGPLLLEEAQVLALRSVAAELAACRELLGTMAPARAKRAPRRADAR